MGTTLTGTTPQDTYDSLIKVTDNGPISGTLKLLSDGLGNDSALALSTSVTAIRGGNQLRLFRTDNGIYGSIQYLTGAGGFKFDDVNGDGYTFAQGANTRLAITSAGNVGIGTSSPNALVEANGNIRSTRTGVSSQYIQLSGGDALGGTISLEGSAKTLVIKNNATSSSDILFDQAVATRFTFAQAGTQILRIDADGVKFGTDSAAANALDDYEEGTWTGTLTPSTSGSITVSAVTQPFGYTKIGRQVTITGLAVISSVSSPVGLRVRLGGLPFTVANSDSARAGGSVTFFDASASYAFSAVNGYVEPNLSYVSINFDSSTLATNDEFAFTFTYFV
jgi:hypothetical protein